MLFGSSDKGVFSMPAQTRSQRRKQSQSSRSQQRSQQRRTGRVAMKPPEPVDYSLDYAYVRRDLRRITLWGLLLFAGMFAVYFVI
jgi:hypothetical protein